jgi:ATP-dependent Clp protease adaptor protein ClpS
MNMSKLFFKLSLLSKRDIGFMIKERKSPKTSDNISESGSEYSLILFNDEFNTFEFVVETLMQVCEHDGEQAYQCTLIAHHNGKCEVKKGTRADLKIRCSILIDKGLSAEIVSKGLR